MPDALTLACTCPGDTSIAGCELVDIIFHATASAPLLAAYSVTQAYVKLNVPGGGGPSVSVSTSADATLNTQTIAVSIGPGAAADWDSLTVTFGYGDSSFQPLVGGKYAPVHFLWSLEQVYLCVNSDTGEATTRSVFAYDTVGGIRKCYAGDPPVMRGMVAGLGGEGGGYALNTSAFSPCGSLGSPVEATVSHFEPKPVDATIDANHSGPVCLCATGGAGDYTFSIAAGRLPAGKTLDPSSGCIVGDSTAPGSDSMTFKVTDRDGNEAEVTCNLLAPCDCDDKAGVGGNAHY